VFRAYEPEQDRLVAVKLFRLDLPPDRVHRLVAELEQLIAADLTHPAIATPIAAGVAGVSAYLAQDFVAAESLDTHVRERRVSAPSEVVRVMAQVAAALDVAAAGRVVHGALHPRDLLVSPDDVRVTGLGIARALERVGVTAPVRRPYTAPERVGGRAWDRRADVFSLAVLAHEMLWGRRPSATGARAAEGLSELPGADLADLRAVFGRALADAFTDRFDGAEHFVDALRAALGPAAEASGAEPTFPDQGRRSTSPLETVDVVTPFPIEEPTDVVEEIAREEREQRSSDLDQFRAASELERFAPEPLLPSLSFEAVVPAGADVASGERDESPAPAALAEAPIRAVEAESQSFAPEVTSPLAPGKVARGEPDRRPRSRERTAQPHPRTVRGERPLFLETAESSSTSTTSTGSTGITGPGGSVSPAAPAGGVDMGAHDDLALATFDRAGSAVWPLVMALGVGIALGFAVGYGVGGRQRAQSPSPAAEAAASPAAPAERPAQAVEPLATPPSAPATPLETRPPEAAPPAAAPVANVANVATGAREPAPPADPPPPATAVARPTAPAAAAPAPRAAPPAAAPSRSPRPAVAVRPAPAPPTPATATLLVDSRPAGANVFLDGRLIGTTPLSLPNVAAGDHAVRIELAGYNQWAASVSLDGGERRRVAASLER
jgi:serine/threonine protein kinase